MDPHHRKTEAWSRVGKLLARQHQVISRRQVLRTGLTDADSRREVGAGRWVRDGRGLFRVAGSPRSSEARLHAACLATGGCASHEWAAWWWGFAPLPTTPPSVTVARTARAVRPGLTVHRREQPRFAVPPLYRHLRCTDPVTTLIDYATVADCTQLDEAVDAALSAGRVSVAKLMTEHERLRPRRQAGVGAVLDSLRRSGYLGSPRPSVLEQRTIRLLTRNGIQPLRSEEPVLVDDHWYRLDFTLAEGLALEVEGFAFHGVEPRRRRDHRRRNELLNRGWKVLVYTWQDIVEDGPRVVREVREALAALAA